MFAVWIDFEIDVEIASYFITVCLSAPVFNKHSFINLPFVPDKKWFLP